MRSQAPPAEMSQASSSTDSLHLLIFKVDGQIYGLPVTTVVRIIEMVTITHLPGGPDTIKGIINLRGKAVPIMDLRHRFGLTACPYGLHTPIILVDMTGSGQVLGLVVDTVEDVLAVSPENLELTEAIIPTELVEQMAAQAAHLAGVAKVDRRIILLLNVQALLTIAGQRQLSHALSKQTQKKMKGRG